MRSRFKVVDSQHAEALLLEYVLPSNSPDPSMATIKLKYRLFYSKKPAVELEEEGVDLDQAEGDENGGRE
ncbi:MAG: hypothetical protein ACPIOQ_16765 [Promethearchaeia archaeon]